MIYETILVKKWACISNFLGTILLGSFPSVSSVRLYISFLFYDLIIHFLYLGVCVTIDIIVESAVYGSYTKAIGQGYTVPAFCVFVAFWSQLFLEYWKRAEATKAMEWGTRE